MSKPLFGVSEAVTFTRIFLVTQLFAVLMLLLHRPSFVGVGPREHYLSVFGGLIPDATWDDLRVVYVFAAVFVVGMLAWILQWTRLGPALALGGLFVVGAWRAENDLYICHQIFVPLYVLTVVGVTSMRRRSLEIPASTYWLATVLLGWTYTTSGLEKLWSSGLAWGDGTSLRLWFLAYCAGDPVASWVVGQPLVARLGQTGVLFLETFAVFGLAWHRTRVVWGLALLGFHLSLEWWMGLMFYGNEAALLVLCVLAPLLLKPDAPSA